MKDPFSGLIVCTMTQYYCLLIMSKLALGYQFNNINANFAYSFSDFLGFEIGAAAACLHHTNLRTPPDTILRKGHVR
jgi:hypothetical protein